MSAEKIINSEVGNIAVLKVIKKNEEVSASGRVDINILVKRANKIKQKENLITFVFIGLILCLFFTVGIILSF